ncbi:BatD family protein [Leptospira sp. GIMC2001]|uniref:BatD family protein n=1 Tax=Leptospira sp. GIMC2001 TaxID=1513297 RepID=UPI00234A3FE9|nr:BatD family protein [Leptospira sp. GIMC2001]WCL47614.1 BatD family protein [Leptospira sp. GIMC2001]
MKKTLSQTFHFQYRIIKIVLVCFVFFPIGVGANDFEFRLSAQKVAKGEPLTIEFVAQGSKNLKPVSKSFTEGSITAVYSGIVSETKIINLKTTSYTILRFNLMHNKPGKFRVPPISVLVDGSKYTISETYFEVSNEVYQNNHQNRSPYGMFGNFFHEDIETQMSEMDAKLKFQTSKSKIYVGEPIIGYFVFYYRNSRKPHFERNPNESIRFPFFTSELLTGVKISYPEEIPIDSLGKQTLYNAIPYNREIYALTPLKDGKFEIGSTKFDYTNSNRMHYLTHTIHSEPKSIEVNGLPPGAPKSFSGEVGEMDMIAVYNGEQVKRGEPWNYEIKISGLGLCNNIKDPLITNIPKNFPGRIVNLSTNKNQKFTEIQPGVYGFRCEVSFLYGVFLEKSNSPYKIEFSFFNPKLGKYVTTNIQFPKLVIDANSIQKSSNEDSSSDFTKEMQIGWEFYTIGFLSVFGFIAWTIYRFFLLPKANNVSEALSQVQKIAGMKSGLLLEKALMQNGYDGEQAKFLRSLRDKYIDQKFTEILSIVDGREKEILNEYFNVGVKK